MNRHIVPVWLFLGIEKRTHRHIVPVYTGILCRFNRHTVPVIVIRFSMKRKKQHCRCFSVDKIKEKAKK